MKKMKLAGVLVAPLTAAALLLAPVQGWTGTAEAAVHRNFAATSIKVEVDGSKLALSPSAYSENGIAFVPMRPIFEALGASLTWEPKSKTIIGTSYDTTLTLTVGVKTAVVNGQSVKLDAAPVQKNGTTFVPARFVAEALEAEVLWDNAAQTVRIKSSEQQWNEEYEEWLLEQEQAEQSLEKLTAERIAELYDASVVTINTTYLSGSGGGSGVVVGDRYILTNYHVIDEAETATVDTLYGDTVNVQGVAAYDEDADLAIIQTEESLSDYGLPPVEVTTSFRAEKGGKVYAIGSPLGVQNTISEGLISNITNEGFVRYIQTNAPIDHGSSGGALFNEYGQLIGITTSGIESAAQLNFAVSAEYAAFLMQELPETPAANVAMLPSALPDTLKGASMETIQKLMKERYGSLDTNEGTISFSDWAVERDSSGWLVFTANIDPVFYSYYSDSVKEDLRLWAVSLGYELHKLLPDETVQVLIYFDRTFGFEPRGFDDSAVTKAGDGKWRVRYPVIDMQLKDQLLIQMK